MDALFVVFFSVLKAFGGALSSLRCVCCLLCLQDEGEKKAEAVATVVAAVDLARVLKPVHGEGVRKEEEEDVELRIKQQATAEKQVIATKTLPTEPAVSAEQHRVQVSQVGRVP